MEGVYKTENGWRCVKKKDHLLRATWMDYRDPAIHLLTMVTTDREPLLGELELHKGDPENACIKRTEIGEKIAHEIEQIPFYKDAQAIELYTYVVMPDHVHIMLQVHERLPKHLGQYVRWFKRQVSMLAGVTARVEPAEEKSADGLTLGAIPPRNTPLFAAEYHDRVLTGKNQLANMKRYIQDNPRRLALMRANPDLFRIRQQTPVGGVLCTTLGNMFLNDNPLKEALHCSRTLTQEEIDNLKERCLAHAANGTIYVSPAVSEGEKQICRALREAGYPLIIILSEGFPSPDSPHYKYYKPSGVYFEACAAGKLLLIEPDAALYEREDIEAKVYAKTGIHDLPHTAKRYRFVAQNAIAELIAEWDARGGNRES